MAQVFISYKREEKSSSFVAHMKEKLESAGFDVWIDQSLLRPGQQWIQEIDNAIKASIALIVVLTPEAHSSLYVTYEWSFAVGRGMEVIPLLLEETEIHRRLQDIQYIDFRNHWSLPWDDLIDRLHEIETGQTSKRKEVPPFVQRAVDALDSYELEDRKAAIDRLTHSNHPAALEALANAVQHHVDDVRIYSAIKLDDLTKSKDERTVPGLMEAINKGDVNQRLLASKKLGILIKIGSPYVKDLCSQLNGDLKVTVVDVVRVLGEIRDPAAVQDLLQLMKREIKDRVGNQIVLVGIVDALIRIGKSSTPLLLEELRKGNVDLDKYIIEVLGEIKDKKATIPLVEYLETHNERVRMSIMLIDRDEDSVDYSKMENFILHHELRLSNTIAEALEKIDTPEARVAVEKWRTEQNLSKPAQE